jgi:hypothetical protein
MEVPQIAVSSLAHHVGVVLPHGLTAGSTRHGYLIDLSGESLTTKANEQPPGDPDEAGRARPLLAASPRTGAQGSPSPDPTSGVDAALLAGSGGRGSTEIEGPTTTPLNSLGKSRARGASWAPTPPPHPGQGVPRKGVASSVPPPNLRQLRDGAPTRSSRPVRAGYPAGRTPRRYRDPRSRSEWPEPLRVHSSLPQGHIRIGNTQWTWKGGRAREVCISEVPANGELRRGYGVIADSVIHVPLGSH